MSEIYSNMRFLQYRSFRYLSHHELFRDSKTKPKRFSIHIDEILVRVTLRYSLIKLVTVLMTSSGRVFLLQNSSGFPYLQTLHQTSSYTVRYVILNAQTVTGSSPPDPMRAHSALVPIPEILLNWSTPVAHRYLLH